MEHSIFSEVNHFIMVLPPIIYCAMNYYKRNLDVLITITYVYLYDIKCNCIKEKSSFLEGNICLVNKKHVKRRTYSRCSRNLSIFPAVKT